MWYVSGDKCPSGILIPIRQQCKVKQEQKSVLYMTPCTMDYCLSLQMKNNK